MTFHTTPSAFAQPTPFYKPQTIHLHGFKTDADGTITHCEPADPDIEGYSVWVRGINEADPDDFDILAVYEADFDIAQCGGDIEAFQQAATYALKLVRQLGIAIEEY